MVSTQVTSSPLGSPICKSLHTAALRQVPHVLYLNAIKQSQGLQMNVQNMVYAVLA